MRYRSLALICIAMLLGGSTTASTASARQFRHAAVHDSPSVSGFVVFYDDGSSQKEWVADARAFREVYFDSANILPNASIEDSTPKIAWDLVQKDHLNASICISNYGESDFDAAELQSILEHPSLENRLVRNIANLVRHTPFAGVNIDFELNPARDATRFVDFLANLHAALHAEHKILSVDVPAKTVDDTWDGGYDYTLIAAHVDEVLLMSYDYSYPGGPAGPIAPVGWVKATLAYALKQIPLAKLRLGLPVYGYDWQGLNATDLTLGQVSRLLTRYRIVPKWDSVSMSPYFTYVDAAGNRHTVFYENSASLRAKLQVAQALHIPGVFTWYIGADNTSAWHAINSFGQ